jgi:hypothetical protein
MIRSALNPATPLLGPIETGMLDRFTGAAERKAGLIARVPLKRAGTRGRIKWSASSLSNAVIKGTL